MCFCSAVSGLHRLWCQALLKLAALSDAVGPAFLSPIQTLNRHRQIGNSAELKRLQCRNSQGAFWESSLSGHRGGAMTLALLLRDGLWSADLGFEVGAFHGGQSSSWSCMCSCSSLPEVKEGKLEICVVCKRDIKNPLAVCMTPETQMNPNVGFHQRPRFFLLIHL